GWRHQAGRTHVRQRAVLPQVPGGGMRERGGAWHGDRFARDRAPTSVEQDAFVRVLRPNPRVDVRAYAQLDVAILIEWNCLTGGRPQEYCDTEDAYACRQPHPKSSHRTLLSR